VAGLPACDLVVGNGCGLSHVAGTVGVRALSLSGAGYRLPTAERGCLRPIDVATVAAAVHEHFIGSNL
jgi:ADP-heptose:LPS heptosyltransferase